MRRGVRLLSEDTITQSREHPPLVVPCRCATPTRYNGEPLGYGTVRSDAARSSPSAHAIIQNRKRQSMTVAAQLAQFLTRSSYADLPAQAIDHAAMLIASTIASASLGSTQDSSKMMRELELERGGVPEATVWFG